MPVADCRTQPLAGAIKSFRSLIVPFCQRKALSLEPLMLLTWKSLKTLSAWRYSLGLYFWPYELEFAQKILRPRRPKVESV